MDNSQVNSGPIPAQGVPAIDLPITSSQNPIQNTTNKFKFTVSLIVGLIIYCVGHVIGLVANSVIDFVMFGDSSGNIILVIIAITKNIILVVLPFIVSITISRLINKGKQHVLIVCLILIFIILNAGMLVWRVHNNNNPPSSIKNYKIVVTPVTPFCSSIGCLGAVLDTIIPDLNLIHFGLKNIRGVPW